MRALLIHGADGRLTDASVSSLPFVFDRRAVFFAVFLIARAHERRSTDPAPTGFVLQVERKSDARLRLDDGLEGVIGRYAGMRSWRSRPARFLQMRTFGQPTHYSLSAGVMILLGEPEDLLKRTEAVARSRRELRDPGGLVSSRISNIHSRQAKELRTGQVGDVPAVPPSR